MFVEIKLTGLGKNLDNQIKNGLQYRFSVSKSIILDLSCSIFNCHDKLLELLRLPILFNLTLLVPKVRSIEWCSRRFFNV